MKCKNVTFLVSAALLLGSGFGFGQDEEAANEEQTRRRVLIFDHQAPSDRPTLVFYEAIPEKVTAAPILIGNVKPEEPAEKSGKEKNSAKNNAQANNENEENSGEENNQEENAENNTNEKNAKKTQPEKRSNQKAKSAK